MGRLTLQLRPVGIFSSDLSHHYKSFSGFPKHRALPIQPITFRICDLKTNKQTNWKPFGLDPWKASLELSVFSFNFFQLQMTPGKYCWLHCHLHRNATLLRKPFMTLWKMLTLFSVRSPSFLDSPVQNYLHSSAVIGTRSANSMLFVWPAS